MPDQFTKVTTKGYGTRLGESVGRVIVGVLMFLGSFGLLYWNEGRADLSDVAANAVDVSAAQKGDFVWVTGEVTGSEEIADGLYLNAGPYLEIVREVEMYAWVEKTEESSNTNLGGSETTTTTYNYVKEWTESPESSGEFEYPEGHINPSLPIEGDETIVRTVLVDGYKLDGDSVELPPAEALDLTDEIVELSAGAELANNEYIFLGNGSIASPQLGDVRISYRVVSTDFTGTAFGVLDGTELEAYVDEDGNKVYRLFDGSRDEALAQMHGEFVATTWILRILGFALMWGGLAFVFGPISVLLDILPVAGSLSRFLVIIITLPVALVLSLVTIVISAIIHNTIALIIAILLVIGALIAGAKAMRKKKV